MPISDPRDRFFYPHHTPMKGTYSLTHGLRQLTREAKSDVSCLQNDTNAPLPKSPNDVRSWSSYNVNCKNFKEIIQFYSLIGKKNNQSPFSDADREIPNRGSMYNDENTVNLVSGIIR